jgi:CBS-domain-containing membrane protein
MEAFTCADIMSRDLVTVAPEAGLEEVAGLFRTYGFTSLPVVKKDGSLAGVILQIDLIRAAGIDTPSRNRALPGWGGSAPLQRLMPCRLRSRALRLRRRWGAFAPDVRRRGGSGAGGGQRPDRRNRDTQ